MTFIEQEAEKVAKRIKEKVLIFPSWETRGLDDKRKEFEAHKGEYTYPLDKIEKDVAKEKSNRPKDEIFEEADAKLKQLSEKIKTHARQLVEQAFSKGLTKSEEINDKYINRIAEDIMNKTPEECVITVPDKWFPLF